jgi:diaminohydroxyphosphoribosylaminopyrimidine deaminase/5-amino-6-(5-phosphoribosylamino)uracil reductase
MRTALRLARRGYGHTSPNPMVGALLVKRGKIIGRGWHHRAGQPHAEIEALHDAARKGHSPRGGTLYVTLEPCCTHGRTPPCTAAIIAAGIKRVVVGTTDPNPAHAGKGLKILKRAGIKVEELAQAVRSKRAANQVVSAECARLNEAFNHWIVRRTPFVIVKAAMTLDGKIATASGESKWITGPESRAHAMHLRQGSDVMVVGVNTVLADDPSLTVRLPGQKAPTRLRRVILDSMARTPLSAKVVSDEHAALTTLVVSRRAPKRRIAALSQRVNVLVAPETRKPKLKTQNSQLDLCWLLKRLGKEQVTRLLVEGGGEVSASFLFGGLSQRVAFFYAPKVLGGRDAKRAVGGDGAQSRTDMLKLIDVEWQTFGPDLFLSAKLAG